MNILEAIYIYRCQVEIVPAFIGSIAHYKSICLKEMHALKPHHQLLRDVQYVASIPLPNRFFLSFCCTPLSTLPLGMESYEEV
jgi:hypothetical protein